MTRADAVVETAADRLESFVREARRSGGVKAKLGNALAEDPEFVRRLKPSLIKARAKGQTPVEPPRSAAEAETVTERPRPKRRSGGGPSPWLVVGAALVAGIALAKVIDWRGHAHPRL